MRGTRLHMDAFGKEAIEQYAERKGISASEAVRAAALYYLADRERDRRSWRVPRFIREIGDQPAGEPLQVDIDDETWAAVEQEAQRQGVRPALLMRHAVMYLLAEQ